MTDIIQKSTACKRISMITYSFYESDNRVIRYAEALAERGNTVEVVALRRSHEIPKQETINGVRVFRIQERLGKSECSKLAFLWPLIRFLLASSWWLTVRHKRQHFDLVHVHNVPDFLVFAAWFPRLTGAKVILDIHDIVPELFGSKFGAEDQSMLVRCLKLVEKLSAAFADRIILSNHLWMETYTARSAQKEKCCTFINNVDSRIFRRRLQAKQNASPVILFPGGLQWHQGLDIAIRAFDLVLRRFPQAEFHIYGDGSVKSELVALAGELGLKESVRFFEPLRLHEIAEVIANADLGVVPKRADSFGDQAYSTKIMEFMSVGIPVVVSSTKIDRFYFDDSVVRFFESGNPRAMAEAMLDVLSNEELRSGMVARGLDYARQNSWENLKGEYLQLVDSLISKDFAHSAGTKLQPILK